MWCLILLNQNLQKQHNLGILNMKQIARQFKDAVKSGKKDPATDKPPTRKTEKVTASLKFKQDRLNRKAAEQQNHLAAEYEADSIRQTAEDYDQFELLLNSLDIDRKRLSGLAVGDKIKLQNDDLIPKYLPIAEQYVESGDSYRNLVLVEVIIMLMDCGRIPDAMGLVDCAMEQKQPMPERFKKTNLPTFIAEKVLDWTNVRIAKDEKHDPEFYQTFEIMLEDGWKVPRELTAKYHKLAGDIDLKEEHLDKALEHFTRAMEIDPSGSRCGTRIDKVKKKLAKS